MSNRIVYRTSVEYLSVSVTSDVTLDTQPVSVSVDDRATWITATWLGAAATTRSARILLNGANMPTAGQRQVYVKVVDSPETPVFAAAGTCTFK